MQSSIKRQLVSIPEFIEFEFNPEQQLHTFIEIQNLTDDIISYRIKTNAPSEYLVKPMEGQIYIREKTKVVFKRKKLSSENFRGYLNGSKPLKQKFMFVITCKTKNAIDIEKVQQENKIAHVKFIEPRRQVVQGSPAKKIKKPKTIQQKNKQSQLMILVGQEKQKLQELRKQRLSQQMRFENLVMQSKLNTSNIQTQNNFQQQISTKNIGASLSRQNIISLLVIFLLLGMWL